MDLSDVEILKNSQYRQIMEEWLERDPEEFALKLGKKGLPVAQLASQLKVWQKCKFKLPSFYKNRCILSSLAYEQATDEHISSLRPSISGKRLLDLTCGAGSDLLRLAPYFSEVIALEPNPSLIAAAQFNFPRLNLAQVILQPTTAEAFLANYSGPEFDWIFVDPDRRDAGGKRKYDFHSLSPDVLNLQSNLLELGKNIWIKGSPMFDPIEGARVFESLKGIHILSRDGEIKEISYELQRGYPGKPFIHLHGDRKGRVFHFSSPMDPPSYLTQMEVIPAFLWEPDPAFYRSGMVGHYLISLGQKNQAQWNGNQAYVWAQNPPPPEFAGRAWEILEVWEWKPGRVKQMLKEHQIERISIGGRDFDLSLESLYKTLGVKSGGDHSLLFFREKERGRGCALAKAL